MDLKMAQQLDLFRKAPKVLLHDHLDGGVRPETVIDLAAQANLTLPARDPKALADWFHMGANRGNLKQYLEGFGKTCAVMQSEEALERIAFEMLEDMRHDGVCYVETRFAPIFHMEKGLNMSRVVNAVLRGLEQGRKAFGVRYGLILCSMRNMDHSLEVAELAVSFRDQGVVGFDLAGEEIGYPAKRHLDAFHFIQRENFYITIHAGEAFGKESIWQAIQYCGAHRVGHGVRLKDDLFFNERGEVVGMGRLAEYVMNRRIPLEICLSSNLHTGATTSLDSHPFRIFFDRKFRVTLNTDNRLMSDTTMSKEFELASRHFNLDLRDLEKITINSMKSAFVPYRDRCDVIYDVIKPRYAELHAAVASYRNRRGDAPIPEIVSAPAPPTAVEPA